MSVTLYPAETSDGTVTSFIPLTTVWLPPSGCASYFRLNGPSLVAWDPGYGLDIDTNVRCAPSAVTTWWEQGALGGGGSEHTAVSIGPLTCPENFSTVASSVKNGSSTLAMCCPSGYYLANRTPGKVNGDCLSDVSSGMTLTYASTPYSDKTAWKTETTTVSKSSTVGAIAVVGWNIRFATPTPTLTPTATSTTTSGTRSASSETTTSITTSSTHGDLTIGAKVGIGVGVGVGAIGVIALLVALYFFKHRKRRAPAELPAELPAPDPRQPPMYQPVWPPVPIAELPATKVRPGQGSMAPAELGG
ncbi:hypothetical protein BDV32DRAFT_142082 [Aspergillus pseudonomiae]|uniref:Uncharacterized protein n=1 Tax=Aspergillus pseudonomiae TaxID=1506151 RepID=A0A5N6HNT5_9EURO|nr:uncharacterized protein BDV37DRAFT_275759 [Aspergillus pseudonomiae]KAB8255367.1 hypothetical protein BDV32DRAFT_142082 [Aspergillus pseudonomiae]KAE8398821.1 hypothetical protein BDV37DRAFT_275759 [Aspergillus pseudonomiae]